ncbi:MAG: tyrosine-type recombinase/integrase [Conexibacter sp.]
MSIERIARKSGARVYRVRWREHGRNRARAFDRRADAEAWDREVKRRQQLGPLAVAQLTEVGATLAEWVIERWTPEHGATLALSTRASYAAVYGKHIAPHLDAMPLREITVSVLRRWQAGLIAAGVGHGAIMRARAVLSSMLRHAAESEAMPANPLTLVRAPRAPHRESIRPLAPATVESIRACLDARDATLVSVLAYAGLRPGEALALRWSDVRERTILVQRASDGYGGVKTTKTRSVRTVRLLAPLAADLREWRLASGRPDDDTLIFPGINGRTVTREAWKSWTRRTWADAWRAAQPAGPRTPRVYDLRHSYVSLLLAEGRTIHYVATQAGHDAQLTLSTYGHLLAEYADADRIDAEREISRARVRDKQSGIAA